MLTTSVAHNSTSVLADSNVSWSVSSSGPVWQILGIPKFKLHKTHVLLFKKHLPCLHYLIDTVEVKD